MRAKELHYDEKAAEVHTPNYHENIVSSVSRVKLILATVIT